MYPVWEGVGVHSAMFVAIIASFHVVASHLTVGAAWFNLYVERRAVREDRPELYDYLKRSARGLLVFAYVFGAMAGVGIWQSTTAANPRGISALIHNFVLFWGSEWYMFMIDVLGIIVYYYTFGRVDRETHLRMAWILALGGTGTLSLIVGILGFKLTPGHWSVTGRPLDGFYNPTFWPQFFLRLAMMQTITAAYAIYIATRFPRGAPARSRIIRAASVFGLVGMAISLTITRFWYFENLSAHARTVLSSRAVPSVTFTIIFAMLVLVAAYLLFAGWQPALQTRLGSLTLLTMLFVGIFAAERTREVMRKPDVVSGYISSNQLIFNGLPAKGIPDEESSLNERGVLGNLPFVPSADQIDITGSKYPTKQIAIGRTLVAQECSSCHSVSSQTSITLLGKDLRLRSQAQILSSRSLTAKSAIVGYMPTIGTFPYMHAVVGTPEEIEAMAAYLEWQVQLWNGTSSEAKGTTGGN